MSTLKNLLTFLTALFLLVPEPMAWITVDVRPDAIVGNALDADRISRGHAIAERGVAAQGGWEAWTKLEGLHLSVTDDWDITPFRMYMPLSDDHVQLEGTIQLHRDLRDSTWTVMSGTAAGNAFGVIDGKAWDGNVRSAGGSGAQFYGPTMEFLPTLAFHVPGAGVVSWIDTVERDGRAYDRVLVTWGDPEAPTASLDQYIVYYAQDSGRLTMVECTVRDFGPFISGYVAYTSWTTVNGVTLPDRYAMGLFDLDGPRVHTVTLDRVIGL